MTVSTDGYIHTYTHTHHTHTTYTHIPHTHTTHIPHTHTHTHTHTHRRALFFALLSLPHDDGALSITGGQQTLIITPAHIEHRTRVSLEGVHFCSSLHVKEVHSAVLGPRDDTSSLQEAHEGAEGTAHHL